MMTLQINYLSRIARSDENITGQVTDNQDKPKKPKK